MGRCRILATYTHQMIIRGIAVWGMLIRSDDAELSLAILTEFLLPGINIHLLVRITQNRQCCWHLRWPFGHSGTGPSDSILGLGNSTSKKWYTTLNSSVGPWKITPLVDGWKPCREPEANLSRWFPTRWEPAHPDRIQPAGTHPFSHLLIYVTVIITAVKQAQLDGIKIGQYCLIQGNE